MTMEEGTFASEGRGGTTMTTVDPKEFGGIRRQRNTLRRHRRRTIGLSMAALIFGVAYLAVTVVFIATVLFLR